MILGKNNKNYYTLTCTDIHNLFLRGEINWLESHFYIILFLVKKCVCVCVCVCVYACVGLCVILTGKNFSKMTKFLQV